MTCMGCGRTIEDAARFCPACGRATAVGYYAAPNLGGIVRPREGRMIAGVCAGFALRYGWDISIVRLVLVLALIFGAGTPFIAYIIAWIIIPNGQYSLPAGAGSGPGSMTV